MFHHHYLVNNYWET